MAQTFAGDLHSLWCRALYAIHEVFGSPLTCSGSIDVNERLPKIKLLEELTGGARGLGRPPTRRQFFVAE